MVRLALVCALGVFVVSRTAQAVPPIEMYGKDPEISDVEISADGNKVAMSRFVDGKAGILVLDRTSAEGVQYNLGDLKIRNVEWSSPHHVLAYVSKTTTMMEFRSSLVEFCAVFSLDTRGQSDAKQLLGTSKKLALQSSLCDVEARLWNDTGDVLMSARVDRGGAATGEEALYLLNGNTGRGNIIARGTASTWSWVASPKGNLIARVELAQKANQYRVLVPTDEERLSDWKTVFAEETEIPTMTVYGANAAENALIIGTRLKSDLYGLFEMSLTDGSIGNPLFEPDGVDISGVIADPYTGAIVGASYELLRSEQVFFQNDLQTVLVAAQRALPGWETVRLLSWDRVRKNFVVYAQGARSSGTYFILDLNKGRLESLATVYPDIKAEHIAPVRPFVYKTRDNVRIQGFLTLPPGTPEGVVPKNLPLVVFPHGGPASRDSVRFDWWAQAMASRGYAVLQMNFRGSEGYGSRFENAGNGEWGGKMQDDVTDGVKHLITEGIADAGRICIVGASYGGYAAMAGAAFTPELYKCAVSVAGVSNLGRFLSWQANRYGVEGSTYAYWTTSIGKPSEDADKIAARSPSNAAANVAADVLLIHGKDDTIVPYAQSELMYDALKDAGKPVQLVKLSDEDHYLSRSQSRIEMLKLLDKFLAKHLGPAGK